MSVSFLTRISAKLGVAKEHEGQERWAEALKEYRAVAELDSTVAAAQEGIARTSPRAALNEQLELYLTQPERLFSQPVRAAARDTLARAVELLLSASQRDFPVVDPEGRVTGILERDAFISALSREGQSAPVTGVMRRDLPEIDSHDMVETAIMRLQESGAKTLPVTHAGRFLGLITSENITEYLMIRSALKSTGGASGV